MLTLTALAAAGCRDRQAADAGGRAAAGAPVPVVVATAALQDEPIEIRTFGNVQPSITVTIKPQVSGILSAVHFTEGEHVAEGQLLCSIDPRPAEAAVKQAEALLARDQALLDNARKESERQAELFKQGYVAADALDTSETSAKALVAAVQADEAALQNSRLQLDYCSIRAPSAGRTGQLMVHGGNLVKANETELVTINRIRPVDVVFSVPQQDLPAVRQHFTAGPLPLQASVPQDGTAVERGALVFVDNGVKADTGTIALKGRFDNADVRLWPGQYVELLLTLGVQTNALTIPSRAVQRGQNGFTVCVVKPDDTVEIRAIEVQRTRGEDTVVAGGLKAGETVVIDGQLRLGQGSRVAVKPPQAGAAGAHP